jgi:hypothetical protein
MKSIFYFPELTMLLDSLLKDIPEKDPFDLFEISLENKPIIKSEVDFLFENKETYTNLSKILIANNFAERVDENLIKLTEEGRFLKNDGSWSRYQKRQRLQGRASYWKLYRDANWLPLTIGGFFITTIVSVVLSTIIGRIETPTNTKIQLQIDMVLPTDSTSHSLDTIHVYPRRE